MDDRRQRLGRRAGADLILSFAAEQVAAWLLDVANATASLTTVEVDPDVQAVAVKHLGTDPRVPFVTADADRWLSTYDGDPLDLAFVNCRPGKFHRLDDLLNLLRPGGL